MEGLAQGGKPAKFNVLARFHVEQAVEKEGLMRGAAAVGCPISEGAAARMLQFLDLLLQWNRKVNLTAIRSREEAVEAHLVDSLAAVPALEGAGSVVDLGSGGGFPGIPMAIARPDCQVTLVDAVGKKVGFLKAALAQLGLRNGRAVHARAEGRPEVEGIPRAEAVICRAFLSPGEWLELARSYAQPDGRILAMLGAETPMPATPSGLGQPQVRTYRLPSSGAERRIIGWKV